MKTSAVIIKHVAAVLLAALGLWSCSKSDTTEATASSPDATLPYTVPHGTWAIGNPENTRIILSMYKAWEENKLDQVATLFDSVAIYETAGGRRLVLRQPGTADTLKYWRSFTDTVQSEVLAAVSLHETTRDEDWVCTWTLNRWTSKTGARDSVMANENWRLVNGKIVYSSAYEAKVPR